ncbi:hypothetical protein ALQ04_04170 [Pseudomonas cichorii]|uniref:Uncharacterized protein n=1 Tax=Pseudomonas cichorii TaxID=36746 RepID=A0A3M4M1Z2_PSECI|nr:hypothetical protein [Pseudomonas cichorii]RMQ47737.1 hypothetical protein ALQ04_04170 [Pseudomonas cichorii]
MTTTKFFLVSFFALCCATVFAQDGADMIQKRQEAFALERQQAREALVKVQDKVEKSQTAASAANPNAKPQDINEKPAS